MGRFWRASQARTRRMRTTTGNVRICLDDGSAACQDGQVFELNPELNDRIRYASMASPLGPTILTADSRGLRGLHFDNHPHTPVAGPEWLLDEAGLAPVAAQLTEYFAGSRLAFDVTLAIRGTPFQVAVWQALLRIPWGATRSYADVAAMVGRRGSARAIGAAVGRNPISIIVPCHRVVGSDGSLVGYGWGLDRKRWLLDHERSSRPSNGVELPL